MFPLQVLDFPQGGRLGRDPVYQAQGQTVPPTVHPIWTGEASDAAKHAMPDRKVGKADWTYKLPPGEILSVETMTVLDITAAVGSSWILSDLLPIGYAPLKVAAVTLASSAFVYFLGVKEIGVLQSAFGPTTEGKLLFEYETYAQKYDLSASPRKAYFENALVRAGVGAGLAYFLPWTASSPTRVALLSILL